MPQDLTDDESVWYLSYAKPLPELMLTKFYMYNVEWCHQAAIS